MGTNKKASNNKKKWNRKRRNYRKKGTILHNNKLSPLPQQYDTKLKYVQTIKILTGAGASYNTYSLRLNSLYDPDETGGGHQPYGFDQLAGLYAYYRVYRTHVSIDPVQFVATTGTKKPIIGLYASGTAPAAIDNLSHMQEMPRSTWKQLDTNARKLSRSFDLASVMGVAKNQYMTDDLWFAAVNANPTSIVAATLYAGLTDGSAPAYDYYINITMIFHVRFSILKLQSQS